MTVTMLKNMYCENNPNGHYFDYKTLKFFGERLSEMRVLKEIFKIRDFHGDVHDAYCLSSVQHNAPGGPRRHYSYFDVNTFEHIMI